MSTRPARDNVLSIRGVAGLHSPEAKQYNQSAQQWFRNPSWPALPAVAATDQKCVGLFAVFDTGSTDNNQVSVKCSGNYSVDWGDGAGAVNYSATAVATKNYSFSTASLANTNAPVTFTDSGDLVTRSNHGFQNGMVVTFASITTTTGINAGAPYYVINATTNTFQLALEPFTSAVALTNDGTGYLLPYKIATIIITPQAGQNLTSVNFAQTTNSNPSTKEDSWLELTCSCPNATVFQISDSAGTCIHPLLEQAQILSVGACTSFNGMFYGCYSLRSVPIFAVPQSGTYSFAYTFMNCYKLEDAPYIDTSRATSLVSFFNTCNCLRTCPDYSSSNVGDFSNMFSNCWVLEKAPRLDTSNASAIDNLYAFCYALRYVPELPLKQSGSITMTGVYKYCTSLRSIPALDTAYGTTFNSMFANSGLVVAPRLDLTRATSIQSLFSGCAALESVPKYTFSAAIIASSNATLSIFSGCSSLKQIPIYDTGAMIAPPSFTNALVLEEFPAMDYSGCTTSTSITGCANMRRMKMTGMRYSLSISTGKLNKAALEELFLNLGSPVNLSQSLTISLNDGVSNTVSQAVSTTATAKALTSTVTSATNLAIGQIRSAGNNAAQSMAATVATSLITRTGHNFSNGQKISFSSLGTLTGVIINKIYYIVNATTDTFQLSLTLGGAPITFTGTDATVTMKWVQYITNIAGTTLTFDAPNPASITSISCTYKELDVGQALLKGFTITY